MPPCKCDACRMSQVTRVEVIEISTRKYTKWDCKAELSFQDDGKTLKIFVTPNVQKASEENQDG